MSLASRRRRVWTAGVAIPLAASLSTGAASGGPPPCEGWSVEYSLAARLRLADTPMGQGDGVYAIGPGSVVLRFEDRGGRPGGHAWMTTYVMRERFTIKSKTLFWTTTVVTDTRTRGTPEACGIVAEGRLEGTTLAWSTPVRGYRTDGTLACDGSLCGKFGAPPPGQSSFHTGPGPVPFHTFEFAKDGSTFVMTETFVSQTEVPHQTAYVTLAGREVKRTCVSGRPCG